jgi:hypothetical protein
VSYYLLFTIYYLRMDDFVQDFRKTVEEAAERLLLISEKRSLLPKAEGKWSPKEIIGHLIDSASNNHQRFIRAQFTDDLQFPGYQQEDWVRVQRYNQEPWPQLVQLWKLYNLHLAHVMSFASEATRSKDRSRHNLHEIGWQTVDESLNVTLEYLMRDYAGHMKHHLAQILE